MRDNTENLLIGRGISIKRISAVPLILRPSTEQAVKRRVRFTLTIDFHIRLAAVGTLDSPLGNDSAVIRSLSLTLIKINRESVVHQGEVVETIS